MNPIYLDYNATTPLAPEVTEALNSILAFGNPSSAHWAGREARDHLNKARSLVASALKIDSKNIIFTSGGTESIHLALKGAASARGSKKGHIISSAVEHKAVLKACRSLTHDGFEVSLLPVDRDGHLNLETYEKAFQPETFLVSLTVANNETGVLFPIKEIVRIAKQKGVLVHLDAVQAAGKVSLDYAVAEADFVSMSGHKIYGPKGVGLLVWKHGTPFQPILEGGGQEGGYRSGTENLTGIVGLATALKNAIGHQEAEAARLLNLRTQLEEGVLSLPGVSLNGALAQRLPNTCNFGFKGRKGHSLLMALDLQGIAVSAGTACSSGTVGPSHVLMAMGRSEEEASSAIRVSLGRGTTQEEIDRFVKVLTGIVSPPGLPLA